MTRSSGLWANDLLNQTVSAYVGSAYNQDASPFVQFCHAAAKIIQKRRARSPESLKVAPVMFILASLPPLNDLSVNVQPMFDRGQTEIAGRIWFGASRLGRATGIALPAGDDAAQFKYVTENLAVGDEATIYYDASCAPGIMRVYPRGLVEPDNFNELSLDSAGLTLSHIKAILDGVHAHLLMTPTASDSARELWEDQRRSYPIRESEKGIQKILHIALTSRLGFGSVVVKQEETSVMGRYDFSLQEQDPIDPSCWMHHAILELKVVKSFTHSGNTVPKSDNQKAVTNGVDQADKYRKDHSCRMAALCCYDMRQNPDPAEALAHEAARAVSLDVALWAWPLYSTAKQARSA